MQTKATIPFSRTPGTTESGDYSRDDTAVVLLGFWHSGLPTLQRVVERLGVVFKTDPFVRLNRRILSVSGKDWTNPPMVGGLNVSRLAVQFQRDLDQATGFVSQINRRWGWVDPVTMVTWPVYQKYLTDRQRRYKVIYIAREITVTAKLLATTESSLSERYAMLLAQAYRSWGTAAFQSEQDKSRWWLLDYEQLTTDRDTVYHEIAAFIRR